MDAKKEGQMENRWDKSCIFLPLLWIQTCVPLPNGCRGLIFQSLHSSKGKQIQDEYHPPLQNHLYWDILRSKWSISFRECSSKNIKIKSFLLLIEKSKINTRKTKSNKTSCNREILHPDHPFSSECGGKIRSSFLFLLKQGLEICRPKQENMKENWLEIIYNKEILHPQSSLSFREY